MALRRFQDWQDIASVLRLDVALHVNVMAPPSIGSEFRMISMLRQGVRIEREMERQKYFREEAQCGEVSDFA